jgi:tellurite resistance protein TehA-like permease
VVGLLPYVIVIGLVCCRWWFFRMASDQATAPSWINMGALAISTLACANIYVASPAAPAVAPLAWAVTLVGMGRFLLRPAVGSVLRRAAS